MTNEKNRIKPDLKTLLGAGVIFVLAPLIPLLVSGNWSWLRGWLYAGITIGMSILSRLLVMKKSPDLIKERGNFTKAEDVKPWDRKLVPWVVIYLPLVTLIVAGLNERFGWPPEVPLWLAWASLVVIVAGYAFSMWAMLSNPFFSSVVRIQTDRGQVAVDEGPYLFVRHPAYGSSIATLLATALLLDSVWALIPAAAACGLVVLRTKLEDSTLIDELPGYKEYTQRTRYRLLPGVW
jgi:protein-S-isoprenylcysteine O-methyltransferase Ste14